jgi:hypothetical protein
VRPLGFLGFPTLHLGPEIASQQKVRETIGLASFVSLLLRVTVLLLIVSRIETLPAGKPRPSYALVSGRGTVQ